MSSTEQHQSSLLLEIVAAIAVWPTLPSSGSHAAQMPANLPRQMLRGPTPQRPSAAICEAKSGSHQVRRWPSWARAARPRSSGRRPRSRTRRWYPPSAASACRPSPRPARATTSHGRGTAPSRSPEVARSSRSRRTAGYRPQPPRRSRSRNCSRRRAPGRPEAVRRPVAPRTTPPRFSHPRQTKIQTQCQNENRSEQWSSRPSQRCDIPAGRAGPPCSRRSAPRDAGR
mmetsp:Transcript_48455/g.122929  ORF Transcript_48455/g.122929 Transcript_48455/m.122929 type:complete len:228 (-) Transcript_48455:259-942(-)